MFKILKLQDTIRIPPNKFSKPLEDAAQEILRELYEGQIIDDIGLIINVMDIEVSEIGRIVPGDGALYHDVTFKALVFSPLLHEVVEGEVTTVESFGVLVKIGPLEGFIHISQIHDEAFTYDKGQMALIGRKSKYILKKGDIVRARIVSISFSRGRGRTIRIGMTMRQPFLGKIEWIKKDLEKIYGKSE